MTSIRTYRKAAVGAVAVGLSLTAIALARTESTAPVTPARAAEELRATVLGPGELAGFWVTQCPVARSNAADWAGPDDAAATALQVEGFEVGLRVPLRSGNGAGTASAARFRTSRGAAADVNRLISAEQEAGAQVSTLAGVAGGRRFALRGRRVTRYGVAFAVGPNEYAIQVDVSTRGHAADEQTNLDAAARVEYERAR